jgi:hypothetical protein
MKEEKSKSVLFLLNCFTGKVTLYQFHGLRLLALNGESPPTKLYHLETFQPFFLPDQSIEIFQREAVPLKRVYYLKGKVQGTEVLS